MVQADASILEVFKYSAVRILSPQDTLNGEIY